MGVECMQEQGVDEPRRPDQMPVEVPVASPGGQDAVPMWQLALLLQGSVACALYLCFLPTAPRSITTLMCCKPGSAWPCASEERTLSYEGGLFGTVCLCLIITTFLSFLLNKTTALIHLSHLGGHHDYCHPVTHSRHSPAHVLRPTTVYPRSQLYTAARLTSSARTTLVPSSRVFRTAAPRRAPRTSGLTVPPSLHSPSPYRPRQPPGKSSRSPQNLQGPLPCCWQQTVPAPEH